jgi:hypothetical protein
MMARLRKGSIVEINKNIGNPKEGGWARGTFGKVIKSRKRRNLDAYKYELRIKGNRYGWFYGHDLTPGKHKNRHYHKDSNSWHCAACGRKVKAPKPCSRCDGYAFHNQGGGRFIPWIVTWQGERVCTSCKRQLPRELKTDNEGSPLKAGDIVQIVGGSIDYLGWFGTRAEIIRRNPKRLTLEWADLTRMYWPYNDVRKTDKEWTLSGTTTNVTKRLNRALAGVFRGNDAH